MKHGKWATRTLYTVRLGRLTLSVEWKLADLWIGLYMDPEKRQAWLCLIPCFPLHMIWEQPATTKTFARALVLGLAVVPGELEADLRVRIRKEEEHFS